MSAKFIARPEGDSDLLFTLFEDIRTKPERAAHAALLEKMLSQVLSQNVVAISFKPKGRKTKSKVLMWVMYQAYAEATPKMRVSARCNDLADACGRSGAGARIDSTWLEPRNWKAVAAQMRKSRLGFQNNIVQEFVASKDCPQQVRDLLKKAK